MDLVYRIIRFLVRFALKQYFKTIDIRGSARCEEGPLLIVSNHPNYLFDPILIATTYNRPIWFMAKSVIFNAATRPLLKALHAIPIYRKMDNPDLMHKNKETFDHATQCFEKGGAILIFPEGLSINQRTFEPIKSGAARMALQALDSEACKGLLIQPLGLTYSTFHRVRSSVTISFGSPFSVKEYLSSLSKDKNPVQSLTDEIHKKLSDLTVEIREQEHARLVEKITTVYSSLNTHTNYQQRLATVRDNLEALGERLPAVQQELEPEIDSYIGLLNSFGFGTGTIISNQRLGFLHVLFLPFHLIAWLIKLLPYLIVRALTWNLKNDFKRGSILFTTSLFTFLIWYMFIGFLTLFLTGSLFYGILAFFISAFIVSLHYRYLDEAHIAFFDTLLPQRISPLTLLRKRQKELIEKLEAFRKF